MTRAVFVLILALATVNSFGQIDKKQNVNSPTPNNHPVAYRLFPTQNMWTFIKLNTRNGQMWQIQFGTGKDKRFETVLSYELLVSKDKEANDRFILYPTENMYTFILLDQQEGKTWQVQWSTDPKARGIVPIE